jgi:hypothetical protein
MPSTKTAPVTPPTLTADEQLARGIRYVFEKYNGDLEAFLKDQAAARSAAAPPPPSLLHQPGSAPLAAAKRKLQA